VHFVEVVTGQEKDPGSTVPFNEGIKTEERKKKKRTTNQKEGVLSTQQMWMGLLHD
jgi:hypothetical protein